MNMKRDRYAPIEAWKLTRERTKKACRSAGKEKLARVLGLKMQIQSAAGSSMHNIAEGFDADTNAEFLRFLRCAKRSCSEVQSQLNIALDQKCISDAKFRIVYDYAGRARSTI
jgi:four helix bundle protein